MSKRTNKSNPSTSQSQSQQQQQQSHNSNTSAQQSANQQQLEHLAAAIDPSNINNIDQNCQLPKYEYKTYIARHIWQSIQ